MTGVDRSIGVRELKATLSEQLRAVRNGGSITVTDRGQPIARIIPTGMPDGLARLIEEGRLSWSGRRPRLPKRLVRLRGSGKTLSEMIIEDRG